MVDAVAATAGWQGRVINLLERERQRSQTEDEHQQDGKGTPHLANMVHEAEDHQRIGETPCGSGIIDASRFLIPD